VLWLSGRYNSEVYAISTRTGRLLALHLCPLAAAAALTLLLCGCGGHSHRAAPRLREGRTVFVTACAGCHTLTGHDTQTPGGDLAVARLTVTELASFVRVMPVRLSRREVDAVSAYVRAVAVQRTGG
jgi:mono/diheme cytochrome c family protein